MRILDHDHHMVITDHGLYVISCTKTLQSWALAVFSTFSLKKNAGFFSFFS